MKTVKVATLDLLQHLKTNREKHVIEFAEAMVGYRAAVIAKLKERLVLAEAGEDVNLFSNISKPQCQLASYDEAISMLAWSRDDEIELDRNEFRQYVQDEWSWKNEFVTTASLYKG